MKTYEEMDFYPASEQLVDIICQRVGNPERPFFRIMAAFYLTQVASMMRASIVTEDTGILPINMYAVNLAPSGFGKGHSMNVLEDQVIDQFRHNFINHTWPLQAEQNINRIGLERAVARGTDAEDEVVRVQKEFENTGEMVFNFDSGTEAAVRQVRHQLLMADTGSINLIMDEIGTNLLGSRELLDILIELYDMGKIKAKLLKNTAENKRAGQLFGKTPTNMMLFGTPHALLDGGKVEDEFSALLEMGYARRCFFSYAPQHKRILGQSALDVYNQRVCAQGGQFLENLSDTLGDLADPANLNKKIYVPKEISLLFIEYQLKCIEQASTYPDHEEMRKSELTHRYFKAMKLAGTYAFIDGAPEINENHAYAAIKLAEMSGKQFDSIRTRDRAYVKLAKYISGIERGVTQADLVEDLPYYKGSQQQKNELMQLATAYGYQNNIIIKRTYVDGIEFLHGETLQATDQKDMIFSYSTDIARGYVTEADPVAFEDLHLMTQASGVHWCSHAFKDGHRTEDTAIPGFNLLVFDVDGGVNLSTARMLLEDYRALIYTTKRHTDDTHRFRIIIPTNYVLHLDAKDHKEFWNNIFEWLPFEVDHASSQRARKWLSHAGHYEYQDGQPFDVLPFIPKTSKNEQLREKFKDQQSLDNLERWILNNSGDGNRNNMLLRYAMILVDGGFDFDGVFDRVSQLNNKMPDKLEESEILSTVMKTVTKALAAK